jgi:hypothetical protein
MYQPSFHENFKLTDDVKMGGERSFGIVFTVVFLLIGLLPLFSGGQIYLWSLIVACVFLILAFLAPKYLRPFNSLWFRFGQLLHKVISPLITGLIFFMTILPIGIVMKILGKKLLDIEFETSVKSYWIHRVPPSPEPGSMKRQF